MFMCVYVCLCESCVYPCEYVYIQLDVYAISPHVRVCMGRFCKVCELVVLESGIRTKFIL